MRERRRSIALVALLVFVTSWTGCQTPTAEYFRDSVFPQDMATKVASAPLLLPMYLLLTIFDVIIVNPVRGTNNVPEQVGNVWSWGNEEPWIGYGAMMPVKLVGIPIVAVGTTLFSEQFDLDTSRGKTPKVRRTPIQ